MTPSARQTLSCFSIFDASSYFLHLYGIYTSSSYIPILETTLLFLIFYYFTLIFNRFTLIESMVGFLFSTLIFYFAILNISQARYQSIHEEKSLTNIYFYYSSASIFVPVLYILRTILDANSIKFESIPKMSLIIFAPISLLITDNLDAIYLKFTI